MINLKGLVQVAYSNRIYLLLLERIYKEKQH